MEGGSSPVRRSPSNTNMKTKPVKATKATPTPTPAPAPAPAPTQKREKPFTPSEEGCAELLRLGKAQDIVLSFEADKAKESARKGPGVIRAQWGFIPHLPFAPQWEALSAAEKLEIREEAVSFLTKGKVSKKAAQAAALTLGFRVRAERSDADALSRARSFLKASFRAWSAETGSEDQEEFLSWAGEQELSAEGK